jgi:hypothetical protein
MNGLQELEVLAAKNGTVMWREGYNWKKEINDQTKLIKGIQWSKPMEKYNQ